MNDEQYEQFLKDMFEGCRGRSGDVVGQRRVRLSFTKIKLTNRALLACEIDES